MTNLILHSTYEGIKSEFADNEVNAKLMQFVEPIHSVESEINFIASEVQNSGKVVFILGKPGTGKSTFIQSLSWRAHIRIREMIQINANQFCDNKDLNGLFDELMTHVPKSVEYRDKGPTCIVINYLENTSEYVDSQVKAFFRKLNGLLRNSPILIIWPVTDRNDVNQMISHASAVSGTIFCRNRSVIDFSGPPVEKFVDISKRTISVLNDGRELSDFSLTTDDLEETLANLNRLPTTERTMREYIELVKEKWRINTEYQIKISSLIPKTSEVWIILSYSGAESVVAQFVRRSQRVEDAWVPIHDKLYEYIHNTQRSTVWDAKRLQLAIYGAIKTRIMFLPTNTLVSCVASYTQNATLIASMEAAGLPEKWKVKKNAREMLVNTPLYKQIVGESYPVGKRKGGPAAIALKEADPIFAEMVKWMTNAGGSDKEINKCVALALKDSLEHTVRHDSSHPWIPNMIPDIFVDMPQKQICIEFHHTNRNEPGKVADYTLKKLDVYMNQITSLIGSRKV